MPAPPLRTALADTYPNPTNAVARTGLGALWDYVTGLLGATGNAADARVALGAMGYAGGTLTGPLNEARGADIASSGTINLSNATGNLVDVTGGTPITSVTLLDGAERTVRFTGVLTLTHGASLVLPGGASITTASGDFAKFRGYAGGLVRCVGYSRASGVAVVAPNAATTSTSGVVELATDAETVAGTDTTRASTPSGVAAALAAAPFGLGVGQSWQDVNASRALNTTYTNSTGRTISVSLTVGVTIQNSVFAIVVNGVTIGYTGVYSNAVYASFVVPPGGTYTINGSNITKSSWSELR